MNVIKIGRKGRLWFTNEWKILHEDGFVICCQERQMSLRPEGPLEWRLDGKSIRVHMEEGMLFRPPHAQRLTLEGWTVCQREDRVFELYEEGQLAGMLHGLTGRAPVLKMQADAPPQQTALLTALALAMLACEEQFVM